MGYLRPEAWVLGLGYLRPEAWVLGPRLPEAWVLGPGPVRPCTRACEALYPGL